MKSKKVYIELTEEQKTKLSPLFDEVIFNSDIAPVMLLAQIHIAGFDAVAVCGIIPNDMCLKIQSIYNEKGKKKVGELVGYKHAQKALKKARKS